MFLPVKNPQVEQQEYEDYFGAHGAVTARHVEANRGQRKERISTVEGGHQAELNGMKEQIANMTAELHKR